MEKSGFGGVRGPLSGLPSATSTPFCGFASPLAKALVRKRRRFTTSSPDLRPNLYCKGVVIVVSRSETHTTLPASNHVNAQRHTCVQSCLGLPSTSLAQHLFGW